MLTFECPHCKGVIEIEAINCGIFKHGKLDPHAPKEVCDDYASKSKMGCGKPFRLIPCQEPPGYTIQICDYV